VLDDDDEDEVENNELWGHDDDEERVGDFFWWDLIVNGLLGERVRIESKKWNVDDDDDDEDFLVADVRSVVKSEFDEADNRWSMGVWTGERSGDLLDRSDIDFFMGFRIEGVNKNDMDDDDDDDESCENEKILFFC